MSVPFLFLIFSLVTLGSKIFSKLCSNEVAHNSIAKFSLILIVNSLVACVFFYISSGFIIAINLSTFIYSIVYATIVALSLILQLIVYRYATISNVNVITSVTTMVCTSIVGWCVFFEKIDTDGILKLVLMSIAVILVFFDQRKLVDNKESRDKRKGALLPLIIIIVGITIVGCANTVILKFFTNSDTVTNDNSFFFFTNVILCFGATISFLIACLLNKGEFCSSTTLLHPKKLVSIVGNTICSNILTIITVLIIGRIDVALYSPISSAVAVIIGLICSLLFKEKVGVFSYTAATIACVAVCL